jgi:hypothetical protein
MKNLIEQLVSGSRKLNEDSKLDALKNAFADKDNVNTRMLKLFQKVMQEKRFTAIERDSFKNGESVYLARWVNGKQTLIFYVNVDKNGALKLDNSVQLYTDDDDSVVSAGAAFDMMGY